MKIAVLAKLRTWSWRQRDRAYRELAREPHGELNHNRPRLRGEIRAYEKTHDRLDQIIKSAHDRWHDRKAKKL